MGPARILNQTDGVLRLARFQARSTRTVSLPTVVPVARVVVVAVVVAGVVVAGVIVRLVAGLVPWVAVVRGVVPRIAVGVNVAAAQAQREAVAANVDATGAHVDLSGLRGRGAGSAQQGDAGDSRQDEGLDHGFRSFG